MPFRDSLNKLFDKANNSIQQHNSSNQPPPVHHASRPVPSSQTSPSQPYWSPTFHPTTPVSANFNHETGQTGWGNNEAQNYISHPTNSFHTPNGQLVIRAIANSSAPTQGEKFTSARLTSHQRLSRDSGCLYARITGPSARGIWPAFWLLPADPFKWPEDGEVDIFEAWNGDAVNHSCLHWGLYNGQDSQKHRVIETPIPQMQDPRGREYVLAWQQGPEGRGGKMVWWIDGKAVMKATIPQSVRRMSDWRIIINVAMGGDVCQGVLPADGVYDFVIHEVKMLESPANGWEGFEKDWKKAKEGHTM